MANKYLDTSFVDKAIKFAVDAHADSERRGKGFPYVIHVLEAMEIVATLTNDPELLAAAALHDTVEDTDVTVEQIRAEFGDRVAAIVHAESDEIDPDIPECDTWRARKQAAIDRLRCASHDAKIVAMGDKLSNMRAIARDYDAKGDELWKIFHAPGGKPDHEWHYRGLAKSLCELSGTAAYEEFTSLIDHVFTAPKMELVDMSEWEVSGDGYTAVSYNHKDGKKMMKLYSDFIPVNVPQKELRIANAVHDMGLPTPRGLGLVTDGTRVGVEFERVTGKRSYSRLLADEPGNFEKYMRDFARMCRQLHSTPCNTKVFKPVEARFMKAVSTCSRLNEEQRRIVVDFMTSVPSTTTCIHGDMHMGNLLLAGGKNYWIDLQDFAYGNPLFDLGMLKFVSVSPSEEIAQNTFHISCAQMRQAWDIFADEYFGPEAAEMEEMVCKMACLYIIYFADMIQFFPWEQEWLDRYMFNKQ